MALRNFSIEDGNLATGSLNASRQRAYSDIDLTFSANPTGDVYKKTDAAAVKQAVKNLLMTGFHEKPFNGGFGGGLGTLLFENISEDTEPELELAIKLAVQSYEPRAIIRSVIVNLNEDANRIHITTTFAIKNTGEDVVIETNLSRLR